MLSIKKHMDNLSGEEALHASYQALAAQLLVVTRDRSPCRDEADRKVLSQQIERWCSELASCVDPPEIVAAGEGGAEILHDRWDHLADYLKEREDALTGIISMLAEAAGRLDTANRDFYDGLHLSMRGLQDVGRIPDLKRLREALDQRVAKIETALSERKSEAQKQMAGLQTGIKEARSVSTGLGKLVHADPLRVLPGRRHAIPYLAELSERQAPFALAAISLSRIDAVARRYGDQEAASVRAELAERLRQSAPAETHLYQWDEEIIVALDEDNPSKELRQTLADFSRGLAEQPLAEGSDLGRQVRLEPRYLAADASPGDGAARVEDLIGRFRSTS